MNRFLRVEPKPHVLTNVTSILMSPSISSRDHTVIMINGWQSTLKLAPYMTNIFYAKVYESDATHLLMMPETTSGLHHAYVIPEATYVHGVICCKRQQECTWIQQEQMAAAEIRHVEAMH